jgi:ABC-type sugar transport system substrate-binding protein
MLDTKPSAVSIKALRSVDWTEEGGYHAVSSWLRLSTSHNESIDAVQAQNDFLALGARRAFEERTTGQERERRIKLPFLGVDGLPRTGQTWVREGSLTATVVVPPTAGQALETLVNAIRAGIQPPERTLVSPLSFPDPRDLAVESIAAARTEKV